MPKSSMESKVKGMFYGIAIGDALGAPVESFGHNQISDLHGRIEGYVKPKNHKYFKDGKTGFTTDDTGLTLNIARSLLEVKDFKMESMVKWHIHSLNTEVGFGGTTRRAIEKLKQGVHWSETAEHDPKNGVGVGNGIAMKVAPIAAWYLIANEKSDPHSKIAELSAMTHFTDMAVISGVVHFDMIQHCLSITDSCLFNKRYFCDDIITALQNAGLAVNKYNSLSGLKLKQTEDRIGNQLQKLYRVADCKKSEIWNDDTIRLSFGDGKCYVYTSLPFSYAFFLRNPHSIETLFDVVNAGGDTDTNASLVGGLMGALHGHKFFPENLVNGLQNLDLIDNIVDLFLDEFLV